MGTSFNAILERFVWNTLGVVALAAPVMIGSVHWPAKLAVTAVSVAILMAYTLLLFRRGYRMRFDGVVLLGVAVVAVMFLQLVPLGDSLLGTLSPTAMAGVEKARILGFEVPTRLSLDPIATAEMLMLAACALALYLVCFNLSYRDGSGNKLLTIVGLSGALVAAIALAQSLSGSDSILWMYTPEVVVADRGPFFATFVNNNHAAAFLTFTAFVLIGVWRKAQFGKSKGIYGLLVVMTLAASCLMMSRGGILALLAGAGLLTVLSRWAAAQRRALPSVGLTVFGIALTMACIIVFLVFFNAMVSHTEDMALFAGVDEGTKVTAWRKAVETVETFKTAGAGAGAFGAAFEPFNNFASMVRFPHAENELLEPLVEFGLPLGILFIAAAAILLWRRFGFARSEAYYAEAFCGLFALWMHNLVDFNIRVPGVLLPVAIALGALSGAFARNLTKHRPWRLRLGCLKLMPIATTVYLLTIVGGTWAWQNGADAAYAAVPKAETGGQLDDKGHQAMAARWVALHPHDSHLYTLLAGWEHRRGEEERAFSLYHRARELCPTCPASRLGMVRLLLDRNEPEQVLKIFRQMLSEIHHGRGRIFTAISNTTIDEKLIAESWGDDPDLLREFARHLKRNAKHGRLERLALASRDVLGYDEEMLNLLGQVYLKERQLARAEDVSTYLMALFPEGQAGYLLQARVFALQGSLEESLLMFEEARAHPTENQVSVSLETLSLLARTRQWDRFESLAGELRGAVRENELYRGQYHKIMAERERMRGRYFPALTELDQAEEAAPFDVDVPLRKAHILMKLEATDKAAAEYRKALRIDPTCAQAAEGLRGLGVSGP